MGFSALRQPPRDSLFSKAPACPEPSAARPGAGTAPTCACAGGPRCAPGGGGGMDPTPALPDPSSQVTAQPVPARASELCRPDITQARQSWETAPQQWGVGATRAPTAPATPGHCAAPAPRARCGSAPYAALPPLSAPRPSSSLPTPSLHLPRRDEGLTEGSKVPATRPPWVPGHDPAFPFPHLETIAVRVSDTNACAQASGFRGGKAAQVTAQRPPYCS